ncbi:MAG TPA: hypothetical protein VJT31_30100 [Rugosimonospora sp.]|nr:hypothetical protein [Rugosimonospora sp.]
MQATSLDLPATVGTSVATGRFLNPATAREPIAVLGAAAATRLGIDRLYPGEGIRIGPTPRIGQWFYLAGILRPAALAPEIDAAVHGGTRRRQATTVVYAHTRHWSTVIPTLAWAGGLAAALLIGVLAGLLPAPPAARMSPTQALWSM